MKRFFRFKPLFGSSAFIGAYLSFLLLTDDEQIPEYYRCDLIATLFRRLPLNGLSRAFGWATECPVPVYLRTFVFSSYARLYGCNLDELDDPNLTNYTSFAEFFTRKLSLDRRPIFSSALMVSPADGEIMHFGVVDAGNAVLEQVKGIKYSLLEFLGPLNLSSEPATHPATDGNVCRKGNLPTSLYQCVIYLSPGDCHRFYSPVSWEPIIRRHFPGRLLSVRPKVAGRLPGLFSLNERVSYLGKWEHGLMTFTAVGAFGVGSIKFSIDDEDVRTNTTTENPIRFRSSKSLSPKLSSYSESVPQGDQQLSIGTELGQFRTGSTIVLVFEAPKNVIWAIEPHKHIRIGEPLLYKPY